jgi:hypothetical protein
MPGFRYCQWCSGKGCMCCEAEQKKFAEKAAKSAPRFRDPDVRDVRDAALRAETERLVTMIGVVGSGIYDQASFNRAETEAHAAVEAAFKPALDAEYARQFPNVPEPIFTARMDNPEDMELLKKVFHADRLKEAFGPEGGGMDEILTRASVARAAQASRDPK